MTFTVKAILHFPDGVNKGQLNVKAETPDEAKKEAIKKLADTWKLNPKDIEILDIKKR